MTKVPPDAAAAAADELDDHLGNDAGRPVSFESSPAIGAALAAHRLVDQLDPALLKRQEFQSIPGGLRLASSAADLIVSPIDAGLNGDFELAELHQLATITGRTTIALRDQPTGLTIAVVTATPLPPLEISNGWLWWDLFDPAFRVISGHPAAAVAWSSRTCLRLVPSGLPEVGPPPHVGIPFERNGFREADRIFRAWRFASLGMSV